MLEKGNEVVSPKASLWHDYFTVWMRGIGEGEAGGDPKRRRSTFLLATRTKRLSIRVLKQYTRPPSSVFHKREIARSRLVRAESSLSREGWKTSPINDATA